MISKIVYDGNGQEMLAFKPFGYLNPIILPVIRSGKRKGTSAWTWNGSIDSPTLKPSIKTEHSNGTVSHIFLNEGECKYLNDSTDGFSGKVLPLQDIDMDWI